MTEPGRLVDVIAALASAEPEAVIYASAPFTPHSAAMVCAEGESPAGLGYLLEAALAREVLHVWANWRQGRHPTAEEAARAGTQAQVVGKPAAAFFATALAHLGTGAAHPLMVGDDIDTDVLAAQAHGLTGVLVKTGKYLPAAHHRARGTPDHVLDSFAGLPALLEHLP